MLDDFLERIDLRRPGRTGRRAGKCHVAGQPDSPPANRPTACSQGRVINRCRAAPRGIWAWSDPVINVQASIRMWKPQQAAGLPRDLREAGSSDQSVKTLSVAGEMRSPLTLENTWTCLGSISKRTRRAPLRRQPPPGFEPRSAERSSARPRRGRSACRRRTHRPRAPR